MGSWDTSKIKFAPKKKPPPKNPHQGGCPPHYVQTKKGKCVKIGPSTV